MAEHGRLIDADALMAEMHNIILEDGEDRRTFYEVIERQPTIEPEQKTGDQLPSAQPYTEAEIQKMQELEQAELDKAFELGKEEGRKEAQPEIVRCKDCKYWRRQTNYAGTPLSFGFCESDEMWQSLYGETYEVSHIDTDDDFYCGYAERREE